MPVISALPSRAIHSSMVWTLLKQAEYSRRDDARYVFHNGMHWISHGYRQDAPGEIDKDLWKSEDAITWRMVQSTTPWQGLAPVVSFNGEMIVVAEKIYRSTDDGLNFTVALETVPWTTGALSSFRCIVYGGHILLFHGDTLWYSNNLTTWNSVALPFERFGFGIWDFNGYVYAASGWSEEENDPPEATYTQFTSHNDVWRSANPIGGSGTWTQINADAPFAPRMWAAYAVHGDEMVLSGGFNNVIGTSNFDDTWVSRDGITWREIGGTTYPDVHASMLISASGKLFMQHGNRYPTTSDFVTRAIYELRL